MSMIQVCNAEPLHYHEYPEDWQFGGPTGTDPRLDPRFMPDAYLYLDIHLQPIHTSCMFVCDDEAIDAFTWVAGFGPDVKPKWLQVRRQGESDFKLLKVEYNYETDEVYDT